MLERRIGIVAGLSLVAVLAGSYATPAVAQLTRPARVVPVRNVDERGRAPYMEFQIQGCPGGGATTCDVVFPAVPAGTRLVLEHVNAGINFAAGGIRRAGLLIREQAIFVLPVRPGSDPNLSIVNEPTLTYFESGQTPIFQLVLQDTNATPLLTVAVSGYLVNLDE